jgi:hypothetical protein
VLCGNNNLATACPDSKSNNRRTNMPEGMTTVGKYNANNRIPINQLRLVELNQRGLSSNDLLSQKVGLLPGVIREPSRFANFTLHLVEGFLQRLVATIQSLASQPIRPAYLEPLQTSKNCVNDQDAQANYLKRKFGVFAPAVAFFVGWGVCGWGWWRLKNVNNWRQFIAGFGCLLLGFVFACFGLGIFLVIAV